MRSVEQVIADIKTLQHNERILRDELCDIINSRLSGISTFQLREQLGVSDQSIRNIKKKKNSKNGEIKTETLVEFAELMKKNSLF